MIQLTDELAGGAIPEAHRTIRRGTDDALPIGAEHGIRHRPGVARYVRTSRPVDAFQVLTSRPEAMTIVRPWDSTGST